MILIKQLIALLFCFLRVYGQCTNLQTCQQCGVECPTDEMNDISQSDCIALIDQITVFAVQYHPSERRCLKGTCAGIMYLVPINIPLLNIKVNVDVRVYRYTCTNDCLVFDLRPSVGRITSAATSSKSPVSSEQCLALALDTPASYMWTYWNSVCFFHMDCAPTLNCGLTTALGYWTCTRICAATTPSTLTFDSSSTFYLQTSPAPQSSLSSTSGSLTLPSSSSSSSKTNLIKIVS